MLKYDWRILYWIREYKWKITYLMEATGLYYLSGRVGVVVSFVVING